MSLAVLKVIFVIDGQNSSSLKLALVVLQWTGLGLADGETDPGLNSLTLTG